MVASGFKARSLTLLLFHHSSAELGISASYSWSAREKVYKRVFGVTSSIVEVNPLVFRLEFLGSKNKKKHV